VYDNTFDPSHGNAPTFIPGQQFSKPSEISKRGVEKTKKNIGGITKVRVALSGRESKVFIYNRAQLRHGIQNREMGWSLGTYSRIFGKKKVRQIGERGFGEVGGDVL